MSPVFEQVVQAKAQSVKKFNNAKCCKCKYELAIEWLSSPLSTAKTCTECTASVCQKQEILQAETTICKMMVLKTADAL